MKRILLPMFLLVLSSCTSTSEPAFDGMWDFTMSSPFGAVEAKATMTTSGSSLAGQFDLGGGRTLAIEEGMVDGGTISFTLTRNGAAMTYGMSGTLEGDTIAGMASAMGAEVPWTMTRAN